MEGESMRIDVGVVACMRRVTSSLALGAGLLAGGCAEEAATGEPAALGSARLASSAVGADRAEARHDHGGGAGRGRWESRGVGGGGALFSPSINPHDGREIFMASDMRGVYRTRDFGRRWAQLDYRIIQGNILSQFRFTADPDILYAVTYRGPEDVTFDAATLAKSTDGGATWDAPVTSPGTPGDAHYLFVDPCDTERLLFSDTSRLYASRNGGRSFHLVHTTDWPGGLLVGGVHWDGRDIYAGTSDGVLVSHDGGARFALDRSIVGIPEGEKIVSFAGVGHGRRARFFAVTFSAADSDGNPLVTADTTGGELDAYAGLYRLRPGEKRWVPAMNGLGPSDKLAFVATSEDDPGVAYVAGGDRETFAPIVLKTVDGGASASTARAASSRRRPGG
ncbi:hypothetical protein BE11_14110 [Sorangium cellulosum]|nr:hypothetical protein BE11_14110 [Sorangium cellulosum]